MKLEALDRTTHDVAAFDSGVEACNSDLVSQSNKIRNRCQVLSEGSTILAFGRYSIVVSGPKKDLTPLVRIDYLARDLTSPAGTGTDMLIHLFRTIADDERTHDCKGVLIDSLNCGDAKQTARRWSYFTEKVGFRSIDGDPNAVSGYAFLPMEIVRAYAAA
ncbi:hypothetical protein [Mameliella alba]|uniref:hypothetical protein n=1 Tax=Mameliella alba TaxID=561184 RepID=UPI000B531138|nr:hypothetical protein [Mameliella alba]MBY6121777.1 hypothetical protein [Mameliella alba]OWV40431.1 hypothetical protein CDZ95_21645 [Mameliella alba]OWV54160.1 hypothetical protein CDZ97_24470 [Mameliella alba]